LDALPAPYKTLVKDSAKLIAKLERRKYDPMAYSKNLGKFMKLVKDPDADPHKIVDAFSTAKFYENDAYYTVGAVLHIVEKHRHIDRNSLYDSIYDNLGFAFEIAFSTGVCSVVLATTKIMKMCKYVARMCDAYKLLSNTDALEWLHAECNALNEMRKRGHVPMSKASKQIQRLLDKLSIGSNDPKEFIQGFAAYLFDVLPKDPLLHAS
jgi:hypothetical protein